jgi:FG-GAP-like repeat
LTFFNVHNRRQRIVDCVWFGAAHWLSVRNQRALRMACAYSLGNNAAGTEIRTVLGKFMKKENARGGLIISNRAPVVLVIALFVLLCGSAESFAQTFTGTLRAGAAQAQVGRVYRDANAATCAGKAYPGRMDSYAQFAYNSHMVGSASNEVCTTVYVTANCPAGNPYVNVVAYAGAFNPGDSRQNYLGDAGASVGSGDITYSFSVVVPGGQPLILVPSLTTSETGTFCSYEINVQRAAARDLSGDGRSDILAASADGAVYAMQMNGVVPGTASPVLSAGSGWSATHTADFTGDGKSDLLVRHVDGRMGILDVGGAMGTTFFPLVAAGTGWTSSQVADFNGDAKPDIAMKNADGRIAILMMNGATVASYAELTPVGSTYIPIFAGDFNGDGRADLLLAHSDGSVCVVLLNGAAVIASGPLLNAGSPWSVSHVGNMTGQRTSDIVLKNTNGSAAVLLMEGTSVVVAGLLLTPGSPYQITHMADFDADGKQDLLLRHTDGSVLLLIMNGTSPASMITLLPAGNTATVAQVADYNGDGKADVLLRNADGSAKAMLLNGGKVTGEGLVWGTGGLAVVPL